MHFPDSKSIMPYLYQYNKEVKTLIDENKIPADIIYKIVKSVSGQSLSEAELSTKISLIVKENIKAPSEEGKINNLFLQAFKDYRLEAEPNKQFSFGSDPKAIEKYLKQAADSITKSSFGVRPEFFNYLARDLVGKKLNHKELVHVISLAIFDKEYNSAELNYLLQTMDVNVSSLDSVVLNSLINEIAHYCKQYALSRQ